MPVGWHEQISSKLCIGEMLSYYCEGLRNFWCTPTVGWLATRLLGSKTRAKRPLATSSYQEQADIVRQGHVLKYQRLLLAPIPGGQPLVCYYSCGPARGCSMSARPLQFSGMYAGNTGTATVEVRLVWRRFQVFLSVYSKVYIYVCVRPCCVFLLRLFDDTCMHACY